MNILVYTFRTFPEISTLENIFGDVFVFGELKKDLPSFYELLNTNRYDLVLGIAKAEKVSKIEPIAVNRFGKIGRVTAGDQESYNLFKPNIDFPKNDIPTTSFCNWTAFKVASFVADNKLETKVAFIHILPEEISKLNVLV